MVGTACGKSTTNGSDGADDGGAGVRAGAAAGGRGGTVNTGGNSQGGSGSGGAGRGGTSSGGASGSGGAGDDALAACRESTNFITVNGDLPADFGASTTVNGGCSHVFLETYPWPVSYSRRPPEAPGIQVYVLGCSSDERLRVELNLGFGGTGSLAFSTLVLIADGTTLDSPRISTLNVTKPPFANWPYPVDLSEGVGTIFEGSFSNSDGVDGGPATVSGRFSVCHVANLPAG
jgi:hypothetical protein